MHALIELITHIAIEVLGGAFFSRRRLDRGGSLEPEDPLWLRWRRDDD